MRPDARRLGGPAGAVQAYGNNGPTTATRQVGVVRSKFYDF